ncbi:MAG TPA: NAD-dependent epimerase/dehydratase family protein [Levilinea sp.]|nr:NAD-dependent epimerase/dehydratase family protein [Levilinea sp.]
MAADFYGKVICIFGASGQLGKFLARRILRDGYSLRILARDPEKVVRLAQQTAQVVYADLTDAASLQAAVRGCHYVFHLAGAARQHAPKSYIQQLNVEGARALAEAVLQAGAERFIYVSCAQVYGAPRNGSIDEFARLHRSNEPYIDSKVKAELVLHKMAAQSDLPLIIPQLSMVYGPGMDTWTLQPLRKIAAGQFVLPDHGAGLLHPLYIDDAVDGILATAMSGEVGQAYILCGPDVVTTAEFFGHYARMLGVESIPTISAGQALREATLAEWSAKLYGQPPEKTRAEVQGLMMRHICNGGKAYYNLEFAPLVRLDEGMQRVQEWLRKEFAAQKQVREATDHGKRPGLIT